MMTLFRRLDRILDKPTKVRIWLAMASSLALALMDAAAIFLMLPLVDLASGVAPADSGTGSKLWVLFGHPSAKMLTFYVAALAIGLFAAKDVGGMIFTWWQSGFNGRNQVRTSTQIMRHFLSSPYTEISRRSSAELLRTMSNAVSQVYSSVLGGLMSLAINGLTMAAIAAALLIAAPLPTVGLVVYFGITALVYLRVMKPRSIRAGHASAEASRAGYRAAFAALGGIKETQVRGSQAVFSRRYEEASRLSVRPNQVSNFIASAPRYLIEILFIVAVGVLLLITVATKPSGPADGTTIGLLATFVAAGFRALPSVSGAMANISMVRTGLPYLDLVEAEFQQMSDAPIDTPSEPRQRLKFEDEIRINGVSFTYPDASRPALNNVTLSFSYGRSLALAGSSGAGKTTLVDTLLGLHAPDSGKITVDGVDIARDTGAWQANIGYVPQDVFILDATLAENIAFDQTHDEVDAGRLAVAIAHAQLEDVVENLPNGVNTYIGERGSRLSGGQRQRVGIARALYRHPSILVLDEATSALDNETEHRITEAITALRGTVTVVIVAHRLSTARHADQLAFMAHGKIVATGTFEEVRDGNSEFARLVELGTLA